MRNRVCVLCLIVFRFAVTAKYLLLAPWLVLSTIAQGTTAATPDDCRETIAALAGLERAAIWSRVLAHVPELGPILLRGGAPYDIFERLRDGVDPSREHWRRLERAPSATRVAPGTSYLRFFDGAGALLFTPRSDFRVFDARPEPDSFLPLLPPGEMARLVDALYRETVVAAMTDPRTYSFAHPATGLRPGLEAVPVETWSTPGRPYEGAIAIRDRVTREVLFAVAPAGHVGSGAYHLLLPLGEPFPVLQRDHSSRPTDALVLTVRTSLPSHPEVLEVAPFDAATPDRMARRIDEEARSWREYFARTLPSGPSPTERVLADARERIRYAQQELGHERLRPLERYLPPLRWNTDETLYFASSFGGLPGAGAGMVVGCVAGAWVCTAVHGVSPLGDSLMIYYRGAGFLLGNGAGLFAGFGVPYGIHAGQRWVRALWAKRQAVRALERRLDAEIAGWRERHERALLEAPAATVAVRPHEEARREFEEMRNPLSRVTYLPREGTALRAYWNSHEGAMTAAEALATRALFLRTDGISLSPEQTRELLHLMSAADTRYDEAVARGSEYLNRLGLDPPAPPLFFHRWSERPE